MMCSIAMSAARETLDATWTFSRGRGRPYHRRGGRRIIYAVDIYTGDEVHAPDGMGFPYTARSLQAGPVTANGAIFFVEDRHLKALEAADGRPRAAWGVGPRVEYVRSLAAFRGLVVAVMVGLDRKVSIIAFRADNGKPARQKKPYTTNLGTNGTIACSGDALLFVGAPPADAAGIPGSPRLVAINSDFGDIRFPKQEPAPNDWSLDQQQAPLLGRKTIVCAGHGVYGFDRVKGTLAWSLTTHAGPQPAAWACDISEDRQWIAAVSSEGVLYVLDAVTGTTMATMDVPGGLEPIIAGRSTYILPSDRLSPHEVRLDAVGKGWKLTDLRLYSLSDDLIRDFAAPADPNAPIPPRPSSTMARCS